MWLEGQPEEDGRVALMGGDASAINGARRLTPQDLAVGSRVYGYGGGEVVPTTDGGVFVVSEDDQRWWRVPRAGNATPVTPDVGGMWDFADGSLGPDGFLWCVREARAPDEPVHEIVVLNPRTTPAMPMVAVTGPDFVAAPRPSPDGRFLAWLTWEHPAMPWDEARLWVAPLGSRELPVDATLVAGGSGSAPQQPRWLPDGKLVFLDDARGWWQPMCWDPLSGCSRALADMVVEFAEPPWQVGGRSFDVLAAGELLVTTTRDAVTRVGILSASGGKPAREVEDLGLGATYLVGGVMASFGDRALAVLGYPDRPASLVAVDLARQADGTLGGASWHVLRRAHDVMPDEGYVAPLVRTVPTSEGPIDAVLHLPSNPGWHGCGDELPPLVLEAHGGPTSRIPLAYSTGAAFWTSRGFALLYVNYAGSSGAGREFRERLRGRWGRIDVEDCLAAVDLVCGEGLADHGRVVARGASAGAYTALRTACTGRVRAVSAWSGVADPSLLVRGTHKFESRYVEGLLGTTPPPSPVHADGQAPCPVLLVHGADDDVVPVTQAQALRQALTASGGRVALLVLQGERHGIRSPRALHAGLEAELSFYRATLGLSDPDRLRKPPWVY